METPSLTWMFALFALPATRPPSSAGTCFFIIHGHHRSAPRRGHKALGISDPDCCLFDSMPWSIKYLPFHATINITSTAFSPFAKYHNNLIEYSYRLQYLASVNRFQAERVSSKAVVWNVCQKRSKERYKVCTAISWRQAKQLLTAKRRSEFNAEEETPSASR